MSLLSFEPIDLPVPGQAIVAGIAILDANNDGYQDIFQAQVVELPVPGTFVPPGGVLLINDGNGNFNEADAVQTTAFGTFVAAGDFNNDGYDDMVVGGRGQTGFGAFSGCTVLMNDGENAGGAVSFTETVIDECPDDVGGLTVGDANGDGYLDIYAAAARLGGGEERNRLFIGDGNGGFSRQRNIGAASNSDFDCGATMTDINGDGYQDLLVSGCNFAPRAFRIYLNDGTGNFRHGNDELGIGERLGIWMGVSIGDMNNDGRKDFYLGNFGCDLPLVGMLGPLDAINCEQLGNHLLFLQNPDGTFTESATSLGIEQHNFNWGSTMTDFDLDGDLDLATVGFGAARVDPENLPANPLELIVTRNPGTYYENDAATLADPSTFSLTEDLGVINRPGDPVLLGSGLVSADVNNDGIPDMVIYRGLIGDTDPQPTSPNLLQRSRPNSNLGGSLSITLQGTTSPRDATGSDVLLEWSDSAGMTRRLLQSIVSGSSTSSSMAKRLIFGLGSGSSIIRVTVTWPNGQQTTYLSDTDFSQTLVQPMLDDEDDGGDDDDQDLGFFARLIRLIIRILREIFAST